MDGRTYGCMENPHMCSTRASSPSGLLPKRGGKLVIGERGKGGGEGGWSSNGPTDQLADGLPTNRLTDQPTDELASYGDVPNFIETLITRTR